MINKKKEEKGLFITLLNKSIVSSIILLLSAMTTKVLWNNGLKDIVYSLKDKHEK